MELQPLFPRRGTPPTVMQEALTARGVRWVKHAEFPTRARAGLAFVQLHGSWDTAPVAAQYHHTHWFAFVLEGRERQVYDVNVPPAGGWVPAERWKSEIVTAILREHPRSSGKWIFRAVLDVHLPPRAS
jgi:hypothetical protein